MNIRVNPTLFIDRYFKGAKITQTTREYRIGSKGSKCILKDGSGYFDHEEGNYTSIFNEIKNREGLSTADAIQFCKDNQMLLNDYEEQYTPTPQDEYKVKRLRTLEETLVPFGFTKAHEYLKKRGIKDSTIPENTIYFETISNLLCHKITNLFDEVIGYQTFQIDSQINKIKPPKIFGSCKGGKTPLSTTGSASLILVEGLEDGLTLHQTFLAQKQIRDIWVMIGTSNFMNVELPSHIRKITLALDNDEAGHRVFEKAKERFSSMNLGISRITPDADYKDFNDQLRGIKK